MSTHIDISVVIPIFNEQESLPQLVEEILSSMRSSKEKFEIILVNDGSKDKSGEVISKLSKEIKEVIAIFLRKNYGQTAAMAAGFDIASGKIIVDGSSFKGFVDYDAVVGSWWNHNVLDANKQISPISGSVKEQIVNFVGSKNINLYNNNYFVDHYKIKSKKKDLPNNKKFNFDVWIDKKNNIIVKVSYSKMGNWEYKLKNFDTN